MDKQHCVDIEAIKKQLVELRPMLFARACTKIRNIQLSDELVQEVLLVLLEKQYLLENVQNIRAYSTAVLDKKMNKILKDTAKDDIIFVATLMKIHIT